MVWYCEKRVVSCKKRLFRTAYRRNLFLIQGAIACCVCVFVCKVLKVCSVASALNMI